MHYVAELHLTDPAVRRGGHLLLLYYNNRVPDLSKEKSQQPHAELRYDDGNTSSWIKGIRQRGYTVLSL